MVDSSDMVNCILHLYHVIFTDKSGINGLLSRLFQLEFCSKCGIQEINRQKSLPRQVSQCQHLILFNALFLTQEKS